MSFGNGIRRASFEEGTVADCLLPQEEFDFMNVLLVFAEA